MTRRIRRFLRCLFYRKTIVQMLIQHRDEAMRSRVMAQAALENEQANVNLCNARIARIDAELQAMNLPTLQERTSNVE